MGHMVLIYSVCVDYYTGELPSVQGTAVDLRVPVRLQDREKALRQGDLDVTYCVGQKGVTKNVSR